MRVQASFHILLKQNTRFSWNASAYLLTTAVSFPTCLSNTRYFLSPRSFIIILTISFERDAHF